jgi:hypothetical protein
MPEAKPADLYVGVVELFAVLLPGALLMAAIVLVAAPLVGETFQPLLNSSQAQWVAFGFSSYALGAFVFPIASRLDDRLYDPYRLRQWPREDDHGYVLATALRHSFFGDPAGADGDIPMNTFAWAKSLLMLHAPSAFGDVQRYEAESKFFRSLIVVLPAVGVLAAAKWVLVSPIQAAAALVLALILARLSFDRYAERRHKSTEWAYRYIIALQVGGKPVAASRPPGE